MNTLPSCTSAAPAAILPSIQTIIDHIMVNHQVLKSSRQLIGFNLIRIIRADFERCCIWYKRALKQWSCLPRCSCCTFIPFCFAGFQLLLQILDDLFMVSQSLLQSIA